MAPLSETHCIFIFLASGLMIASRYPIMEVSFHPTTHKRSLWQHAICYGIIMAKVDLGSQKVGYMANLHNVAYQGTEDLIGMQRQLKTNTNCYKETFIWKHGPI